MRVASMHPAACKLSRMQALLLTSRDAGSTMTVVLMCNMRASRSAIQGLVSE